MVQKVSHSAVELRTIVQKYGSCVIAETAKLSQAVASLIEMSPHLVLVDDYQPAQLRLLTELN